MKALLTKSVRRMATLLGRSAGVAVSASAGIGLAQVPAIARAAIVMPAGGTVASDKVIVPEPLEAWIEHLRAEAQRVETMRAEMLRDWVSRTMVSDAPALWFEATNSVTRAEDAFARPAAPDAFVAKPLAGWLAAQALRQASSTGLDARPLQRASSRRPRPGNRPARDRVTPKRPAARTVVWMAARHAG